MRILFTSTLVTPFIQEDITILRKHHELIHLITRTIWFPVHVLGCIHKVDLTFTWFASVYSMVVVLLASMFGRKSIIVVGGVDVAKLPEIGYGVWVSPWKSLLVRYALRKAWKVLAVAESQIDRVRVLAGYDGTNIEYVPTGYDAGFWKPAGGKKAHVLCVCSCDTKPRALAKGLDLLMEVARRLHETPFIVVGTKLDVILMVVDSVPANVNVISHEDRDGLLHEYRQSKVYCQASRSEGMPNSLCEAMLCECVPVGTSVGGIPAAIGDAGFLVDPENVDHLIQGIRLALTASPEIGQRARRRIAETFTLQRREESLLRILQGAAV